MNVSEEGAGALEFSNLLRALHRRAHVAALFPIETPSSLGSVDISTYVLAAVSKAGTSDSSMYRAHFFNFGTSPIVPF